VFTRRVPREAIPYFVKIWSISENMTKRPTTTLRHRSILMLAVSVGTTLSFPAFAQDPVACADLDLPNPVYGSGGSAITATLAKVAAGLAGLDEPITVLFSDPGACTGYQAFLDESVTTNFKYWAADGTQLTCTAPTVGGQKADFAHMGNPVEDCTGLTLPEGIGDIPAPVQTLNIITSIGADDDSISREALYFIYGWGAESEAEPWTIETSLFKRKSDSFVHNFLAAAIGLSPSGFIGTEVANQQAVVDGIFAAAATEPNGTLGYVSGSAANNAANREKIKTLAYQHTGQECGYWPSLTPDTFDALNVRKGLYHFWAPGHFFAEVDEAGVPTNPLVADLFSWFSGASNPEGLDVTELVIKAGDIPSCAMQVTREGLAGAISSYAPDQPCGCYFDAVATGTSSCATCEGDEACGDGKCRRGYCEAY
jgi:hypothetical protein